MSGATAAAVVEHGGRRTNWAAPAAVLLLLGVGAVLAFGCNISACFPGIASGSPHGWACIGPALLGNWVGLKLPPWFGLGGG